MGYAQRSCPNFVIWLGWFNQTSFPYTPQPNGVAEIECKIIILLMLLILQCFKLYAKNIDQILFSLPVFLSTANRRLSYRGGGYPFFFVVNQWFSISYSLRWFEVYYLHSCFYSWANKLSHATCMIFLRYFLVQKGYMCFRPSLCRVFISNDVTFHESTPFFFR